MTSSKIMVNFRSPIRTSLGSIACASFFSIDNNLLNSVSQPKTNVWIIVSLDPHKCKANVLICLTCTVPLI